MQWFFHAFLIFTANMFRSGNIRFGAFSSFLSLLDIAICKMLLLCSKIWTAALLANAEVHSFLAASALAKLRAFLSSQNCPGDVWRCRTARQTWKDQNWQELIRTAKQVHHGRRPFRQCLRSFEQRATGDPGRASANSQASDVDQLSQLLGEPQSSESETIFDTFRHISTPCGITMNRNGGTGQPGLQTLLSGHFHLFWSKAFCKKPETDLRSAST